MNLYKRRDRIPRLKETTQREGELYFSIPERVITSKQKQFGVSIEIRKLGLKNNIRLLLTLILLYKTFFIVTRDIRVIRNGINVYYNGYLKEKEKM